MKKLNKIIKYIKAIFQGAFCPRCNSDAPELDNCPVCDNDRCNPFGIKRRLELMERNKKSDFQLFQDDTGEWSDSVFGDRWNPIGPANHLKEEVGELIEALSLIYDHTEEPTIKELRELKEEVCYELADCLTLLVDTSRIFGVDTKTLLDYSRRKLHKNRRREWTKPDEKGICRHKKI